MIEKEIEPDVSGNVQLRGFLYQTKEGFWILSKEPQLKSCCVGAKEKVMEQVFLSGDLAGHYSPATVVDVTGILTVNPLYSESGEVLQYYQLQNAVIQNKEINVPVWEWVGSICFVAVMVWLFRYGRARFRKIESPSIGTSEDHPTQKNG